MSIKTILKKIILKEKSSSSAYIKYLKSIGMTIGDGTVIYSPNRCLIDITRPWLIEIGENVQITEGVTILTHGYDWSVIKGKYGHVLGSAGKVVIGNNVFIGVNTTILKSVTIGNNVIIGANTLICKNVPSDCVVVGNPQRIISTLDNYYTKRKNRQIDEAIELLKAYIENTGFNTMTGLPPKEIFSEFFWLFEPRSQNGFDCPAFEEKMRLVDTYDLSVSQYEKYKRPFDSYEQFIHYALKIINTSE